MWRAWPLRVALTMGFLILLALALLIIVLTGQLASSIGDALGIEEGLIDLYSFLKWPALLVVVVLLVALLYRTSPSGERSATHWRVLTPGGAIAVAAWVVVSVGFEVYVNAFATYDTTYGALGTTIAALVWLWLTNLTLLMGVELDAAIEFRKDAHAWLSGCALSASMRSLRAAVSSRKITFSDPATGTARIAPITPIRAPPTITTAIVAKPDSSIACR